MEINSRKRYTDSSRAGPIVSADRRLNYRVSPNIERAVFTDLVLEDGEVVRVSMIDVSAGGAGLGMVAEGAPEIRAGSRITVRFSSKRLLDPLEIASQIRHVKIDEGLLLIGIAFDDWGDTRMNLAPQLRSLFNEREAVRVEPRVDQEVAVMVQINGSHSSVEGLLRDISILGLGMWVPADDDVSLAHGEQVHLEFNLPPSNKKLHLEASVCHHQLVGERARVGLQIVTEQVGRWNGVYREITQYVMTRQLETARVDAERKQEKLDIDDTD
jgi:c-di-GMP-binding flagellar brake protein YcgR